MQVSQYALKWVIAASDLQTSSHQCLKPSYLFRNTAMEDPPSTYHSLPLLALYKFM